MILPTKMIILKTKILKSSIFKSNRLLHSKKDQGFDRQDQIELVYDAKSVKAMLNPDMKIEKQEAILDKVLEYFTKIENEWSEKLERRYKKGRIFRPCHRIFK